MIDATDIPALIAHLYERVQRAEAQVTACQAEANRQLAIAREVEASWRARHKAAMVRIEALRITGLIDDDGRNEDRAWNACLSAVKAAIRGEGGH